MPIYTRTGDDGTTGLFGGPRVTKDHIRVETYGQVDELNSTLGWCMVACPHEELLTPLRTIQAQLFDIGADLATPADSPYAGKIQRVGEAHIKALEMEIDRLTGLVEPMRYFILPGGSELAARLHMARTVCRRAERWCVRLAAQDQIGPWVVTYINRLSDLLFTMARRANQLAKVEDVPWKANRSE